MKKIDKIYYENEVDCKWCGNKTNATTLKECAFCWELRWRIETNIELTKKILKTFI